MTVDFSALLAEHRRDDAQKMQEQALSKTFDEHIAANIRSHEQELRTLRAEMRPLYMTGASYIALEVVAAASFAAILAYLPESQFLPIPIFVSLMVFPLYVIDALNTGLNKRGEYLRKKRQLVLEPVFDQFGDFAPVEEKQVRVLIEASGLVTLGVPLPEFCLKGTHKEKEVYVASFMSPAESDTVHRTVLFISVNYHVPFEGMTLVRSRMQTDLARFFHSYTSVDLEANEFSRAFSVTSTSPTEARLLLHPKMMVDLLDISERVSGCGVDCSFTNGRMNIFITLRRTLFKSANQRDLNNVDAETLKKLYMEVAIVFTLIDHFDMAKIRLK